MFMRNGWYVGAWSDEITATPLGRMLLEEPVVFYRTESGAVVALADQCCHRGLRWRASIRSLTRSISTPTRADFKRGAYLAA